MKKFYIKELSCTLNIEICSNVFLHNRIYIRNLAFINRIIGLNIEISFDAWRPCTAAMSSSLKMLYSRSSGVSFQLKQKANLLFGALSPKIFSITILVLVDVATELSASSGYFMPSDSSSSWKATNEMLILGESLNACIGLFGSI